MCPRGQADVLEDSTSAKNNELRKCRTSGLQNKIRPFANYSNKKGCQNRDNSAKHKGVLEKKRVVFKAFTANGCMK